MHIQLNTDNNITGSEELTERYRSKLEGSLSRFGDRITRIEIYLSDMNSHKGGKDDIRCVLEARLNGLDPIAVSDQAESVDFAFNGASDKLKSAIESTIGKLRTY
jgi:ribosome-associated translation inhibitor RaiA